MVRRKKNVAVVVGNVLARGIFFSHGNGAEKMFCVLGAATTNTWAWAWATVTWAAACVRLGRGRGGEGRGSSAPKAPAPAQAAISGTESESPGLKSHPPGTRLVDSWRAAGSKQGSRQEQTVFKLTRLKSGLLPLCLLRHVSICGYSYISSIHPTEKAASFVCAHSGFSSSLSLSLPWTPVDASRAGPLHLLPPAGLAARCFFPGAHNERDDWSALAPDGVAGISLEQRRVVRPTKTLLRFRASGTLPGRNSD